MSFSMNIPLSIKKIFLLHSPIPLIKDEHEQRDLITRALITFLRNYSMSLYQKFTVITIKSESAIYRGRLFRNTINPPRR